MFRSGAGGGGGGGAGLYGTATTTSSSLDPYDNGAFDPRRRNPSDDFRNLRNLEEMSSSAQLIVQSLNFHGQQLTSFMKESEVCKNMDLKKVDYHTYQQRSRELKLEDRGKRLLLHRFIVQKSGVLFQPEPNRHHRVILDNDHTEDHAAVLPPLEVFAKIPLEERTKLFFQAMRVGDTLYCRIQHKAASGLILNVVALDPVTGKSRYVEDLKVKGFCPSAEMVPAQDPKEPNRTYETGDIVRVALLELKPESERFLAGMRNESLPPDVQNIIKLGLVEESNLPVTLKYSRQAMDRGYLYEEFLEKSVGFINPNNVEHLCSELGLDPKSSSLMADLDGKYPAKHYATAIKKAQNSKWAFKHVHLGIKHFKANNKIEAFQCLNQALNIDPQNVEGLVARGALYANNNGLENAINDFEAALKINPKHQNAKKYMCETLIAVGRNYEDDKNFPMALETYERIIRISPDHQEAKDSILYLRGRPQDIPDVGGPKIPGLDSEATLFNKEKLKFMLEGDKDGEKDKGKEKKKKRRRSRTSGSESSDGSGSDDEKRRRSKKKRKDKRQSGSAERSRTRSVSPLSKREAGLQNARAISPFSAKMNPEGGMNLPASSAADYNTQSNQVTGANPSDVFARRGEDPDRTSGGGGRSPHSGISSHISNPEDARRSHPHDPYPAKMSAPPPAGPYAVQSYHGHGSHAGHGGHGSYGGYMSKTEEDAIYNDKVEWFLRQTNSALPRSYGSHGGYGGHGGHTGHGGHRELDYRSYSRHRGRDRSRSRSRGRSGRRSVERGDRRSRSFERRRSGSRGRSGERDSRSRYEDRSMDRYPRDADYGNEDYRGERRKREKDVEEVHGVEVKKKDKEKNKEQSKKSLSPLLDILKEVKDDDLRKKLKQHLKADGDEDKKKKKKTKKSRSVSSSPEQRKEKKKPKMKEEKVESDTVVVSSDDESKKKKKKKQRKKSSTKERDHSPEKKAPTPKREKSAAKREKSAVKKEPSPKWKNSFTKTRDPSPRRRDKDSSSRRRDSPPRKKEYSPRRKDYSPRKKDSSPRRWDASPRRKDESPKKEDKTEEKEKEVYDKEMLEYVAKVTKFQKLNSPPKPKPGGLWIPTGEDSIRESINKAVSHVEAKQKKAGTHLSSKSKFDPHKKISISNDAPPPARDFDVTYDPKIGMYIRVPKQTPPAEQTKAEKVAASKKTRMDKEKATDTDVQEVDTQQPAEQRIIRSVGSPKRSSSRDRSRRSRSRSHSRERHRSSHRSGDRRDDRSGERSGEKRYRSSGGGGRDYKDRRSDNGRDRRYESSRTEQHSTTSGNNNSSNTSSRHRLDYDSLSDIREETKRLKSEREAIEREKAELLAATKSVIGLKSDLDQKKELPPPENIQDYLARKRAEKEDINKKAS